MIPFRCVPVQKKKGKCEDTLPSPSAMMKERLRAAAATLASTTGTRDDEF